MCRELPPLVWFIKHVKATAIEDELEQAFSGKKSAQVALDSAAERGNRLLRQFERASPDR